MKTAPGLETYLCDKMVTSIKHEHLSPCTTLRVEIDKKAGKEVYSTNIYF